MDQSALPADQTDENARYRLLIDAISDYAIYMLDPSGRVSSWNPGAQRFKGYEAHEIVGHNFARFYTPEDQAAGLPEQALATAAAEGRFEREGWRIRKDGSRMWAHVVIDAILDDGGGVIGFAKITRDITERRQQQEALEEARQALFQAQKMESIGQLTGGIAHDFNNLLMAVLGSLELVKKRMPEADAKTVSLLDNAIQGAQRGASLTRRMLAFARRQDLQTEAVDLPVLTQGLTGLLERSIGPGISIRTRFGAILPLALTDPAQLEAALMNLVLNARDAMPDGGQITIGATEEILGKGNALGLAPGIYASVKVTDTGAGMDEAVLSRAMEPFFTTKGVGKGTGLGLSMVHGLAEQSGGRMRLFSRPGQGTTVEIWLPAALGDEGAPVRRPTGDAIAATAAGQPLTILAVDDDRLVLINTSAMLEDLGHTVLEADSGEAALRLLQANPTIDLVITDQVMPHMTGLQLVQAIRARRPDLPVILATGYAEVSPGADTGLPRLAKPFTQAELAAAVVEAQQALAAG